MHNSGIIKCNDDTNATNDGRPLIVSRVDESCCCYTGPFANWRTNDDKWLCLWFCCFSISLWRCGDGWKLGSLASLVAAVLRDTLAWNEKNKIKKKNSIIINPKVTFMYVCMVETRSYCIPSDMIDFKWAQTGHTVGAFNSNYYVYEKMWHLFANALVIRIHPLIQAMMLFRQFPFTHFIFVLDFASYSGLCVSPKRFRSFSFGVLKGIPDVVAIMRLAGGNVHITALSSSSNGYRFVVLAGAREIIDT